MASISITPIGSQRMSSHWSTGSPSGVRRTPVIQVEAWTVSPSRVTDSLPFARFGVTVPRVSACRTAEWLSTTRAVLVRHTVELQ
jgi:hypothetical protein